MPHVFDIARRKHFLSSALRRSCTIASILPSLAPRGSGLVLELDRPDEQQRALGFPFYSSGIPEIRGTLPDEELSNNSGAE